MSGTVTTSPANQVMKPAAIASTMIAAHSAITRGWRRITWKLTIIAEIASALAWSRRSGKATADVAKLNVEAFKDERERSQALLVRAAARFTQAELGADESQRDAARVDVRALRARDARLKPDEVLFSPRFRAFFETTR